VSTYPFQDNLGVGGHLDVHRLALDQLHRLLADEAGHQHLVDLLRQGKRGGETHGGIGIRADGDSDLHATPAALGLAVVGAAALLNMPVHPGGPLVEDLHAVGPAVAHTGLRILGEDHREGDAAAGIDRPALQDGDAGERRVVPDDDLLAGAILDQLGEHAELVEQPLRRLQVQDILQLRRQIARRGDLQGKIHAGGAAEEVDQDGHGRALDVLEEERRAARFTDAVGDLGDLQDRIHFAGDATKLSGPFQGGDKLAQVGVCHGGLLDDGESRAPQGAREGLRPATRRYCNTLLGAVNSGVGWAFRLTPRFRLA
jgi:hypothetical protein